MNGILPPFCRILGYGLLILSVFVPVVMFMAGAIHDSNLLLTKTAIKLFVWFSLFMIFFARMKKENESTARIRLKAIYYAIYLLGVYYIVALIRSMYQGHAESADNSIAIIYMAFNVACFEFFMQKQRVDKLFKNKK